MKSLSGWVIALLLSVPAPATVAKELEDLHWIEVQTPNFQIRSLAGEKKTVELARYMEMFRAAVSVLTNVRKTKSPIPIHIYVLRGAGDFRLFGIGHDTIGEMIPALRDHTIVIRNQYGMKESSTILHEYVHFLVRNHGGKHYPRWYDEGLAEYSSKTNFDGEYFSFGLPAKQRLNALRYTNWIHMRKILSSGQYYGRWSGQQRSMFYTEAWVLVHYLVNRRGHASPLRRDMDRYIHLVESAAGTGSTDEVDAFEKAFGITAGKLNQEVRAYIRAGKFRYLRMKAAALLPAFKPKIVKLSREQAALGLGRLAFRLEEFDQAEHWFAIAAASDITRSSAEDGLGDVLKFKGDFDAAQPHFQKAVMLAPDDPDRQLDLAEYWHARAEKAGSPDEMAQFLHRARAAYVKAWKLDDSLPELYAEYGRSYLLPGQKPAKAIEMLEEAERLLPSSLRIRLLLATAYAETGRRDEAIAAARSVVAWDDGDSPETKQARELLARLQGGGEPGD